MFRIIPHHPVKVLKKLSVNCISNRHTVELPAAADLTPQRFMKHLGYSSVIKHEIELVDGLYERRTDLADHPLGHPDMLCLVCEGEERMIVVARMNQRKGVTEETRYVL